MKTRMNFLIYSLIGLTFLFTSCSDLKEEKKEVEFIIYSQIGDDYNNVYATVYVSDTNWLRIAEFADSLVKGHVYLSVINFYVDSNNVPIMDKYGNFISNRNAENVAVYRVSEASRIFDERKEIDSTEDLSFNLYTINDNVYTVNSPYVADYQEVNAYIDFHNNFDEYRSSTKKTVKQFINLLLEKKLDEIPNLFTNEMDKKEIEKLHELIAMKEWSKIKIDRGLTNKKYNLWYEEYSFIADSDSLKVKAHFDVNKSAEKMQKFEFFYYD